MSCVKTANKNIKVRPSGSDRRYAPALYIGRYTLGKLYERMG